SRQRPLRPAEAHHARVTTPVTPRHSHVVTVPALPRRSSRSPSWKPLLGIGLGMSVVSGMVMAGALLFLRQPSSPAPEGRFIVVEATGAHPAGAPPPSARAPIAPAQADAERPAEPATAEARPASAAASPAGHGRGA